MPIRVDGIDIIPINTRYGRRGYIIQLMPARPKTPKIIPVDTCAADGINIIPVNTRLT